MQNTSINNTSSTNAAAHSAPAIAVGSHDKVHAAAANDSASKPTDVRTRIKQLISQ